VEFREAYVPVREASHYQRDWYDRRTGHSLCAYLEFVRAMRREEFPVTLRFGLEVCHLPGMGRIIEDLDLRRELDFLTGAVHWLDGWGFDHRCEHWVGKDV
jgi:histidinol-phosphatase (PHP family)